MNKVFGLAAAGAATYYMKKNFVDVEPLSDIISAEEQ